MNRFKLARLQAGLSQKAAAIALGISQPSMSEWETGKSRPTYANLIRLADLYHVSFEYLLSSDVQPDAPPGVSAPFSDKKLTADDDELRNRIIFLLNSLSSRDLLRVADFLAGLLCASDNAARSEAGHNPGSAPGE